MVLQPAMHGYTKRVINGKHNLYAMGEENGSELSTKHQTRQWFKENWYFVVLFIIAAFLRFFKISYSFSSNGIDEGVHLMAGRLASGGFTMYSQINTLQGPFFLWVYSLFGGNVIACRILSGVSSLLGLLGVVLICQRIGNKKMAFVTALFLTFNFYFIKEARLASLDMFATVLLIWAFYFFLLYLQKDIHLKRNLFYSGIFFTLAVMTKAFAAIPLAAVSVYVSILWLHSVITGSPTSKRRFFALCVFALTIIVTTIAVLNIYGFWNTLNGIFFNNLHRPSQSFWLKLAWLGLYVGLLLVPFIFAFIPIKNWYKKKEVQLLLLWLVPLLVLYVFQDLTWMHHYTLIVPPLCILGGWGVYHYFNDPKDYIPKFIGGMKANQYLKKKHPRLKNSIAKPFVPNIIFFNKKKKVIYYLVVSFIAVLIISNFIMVVGLTQNQADQLVAEDIEFLTDEDDFIISGNPLSTNYANRNQVPELANLAEVKYPEITSEELIDFTEQYEVKVVVFNYHLSSQKGYVKYIQEKYDFYKAYDEHGDPSKIEGEVPIDKLTWNIYVRPKMNGSIEKIVIQEIKAQTTTEDMIICGDPLMAIRAERLHVPELADIGGETFPDIPAKDLINFTETYQTKLIVLTHNLSLEQEYVDYVHDNYVFYKAFDRYGVVANSEGELPISKWTWTIFIRPDQ